MHSNQQYRCAGEHQFLSPHTKTYGFSNYYSQRTLPSSFQFQHSDSHNNAKVPSTGSSIDMTIKSPFWSMFSRWRALCEEKKVVPSAIVDAVPAATEKMKEAEENMKKEGMAGVVSEFEVMEYMSKETGRDRLEQMFSKDHMGKISPELYMTRQVTLQSAGTAFFITALLASREARQNFIERNQATVFKTRFQAVRRYQDQVILYSIKEGARWAIRLSLFSASFMLISQAIAVYRNKSSVWEYSIAAASIFGAWKLHMGLGAFLVSSGTGALIGTALGAVAFAFMKFSNETQEQRHFWKIQKELQMKKYYETKGGLEDRPVEAQ